jgi:hypothetical protein
MRALCVRIGLLWVALLMGACASLPGDIRSEMAPTAPGERDPYAMRSTAPGPALARVGPQAVPVPGQPPPLPAALRTGQLLVWSNPQAAGLFVNLFAQTFSPWTHVGVVSVEPDGVFVYDSNAELQISADGPARVSGSAGGVLRTPYQRLLESGLVFGLFPPRPGVDAQALLRFVQDHRQRGTPFDPRYDSTDDSALYCSELLALGFVAAGGQAIDPLPVRRNRSYDRLRAWLDLSSSGFHLPGQLVDHAPPLAIWARGRNRAQIEALFAARAELAQRFDASTRLGQLMRWNAVTLSLVGALDLRDAPQRFVDASLAAWAGVPDAAADPVRIRRDVARLAESWFGP